MNTIDWKTGQEFLEALFKESKGQIEFRFIKGNSISNRPFVPIGNNMDWKWINKMNQEGNNVYFGVCPRKDKLGTKEGVKQISTLWCDIDGKDFCKEDADLGKGIAWNEIKRKLPKELVPSVFVDSGNGFHLYWFLLSSYTVEDSSTIEQFEGILLGLAALLGGDHCFDVSRVLRLPGSFNMKNIYSPKQCKILESNYDRRYNLSSFKRFYQKPKKIERINVKFSFGGASAISTRDLRVSERIRNLIVAGKGSADPYKSRSEADFAVILALTGAGHTPDEIGSVYLNTDWKIGEKCRSIRDPELYLQKTIGLAKGIIAERKKKEELRQEQRSSILDYMAERYEKVS